MTRRDKTLFMIGLVMMTAGLLGTLSGGLHGDRRLLVGGFVWAWVGGCLMLATG